MNFRSVSIRIAQAGLKGPAHEQGIGPVGLEVAEGAAGHAVGEQRIDDPNVPSGSTQPFA